MALVKEKKLNWLTVSINNGYYNNARKYFSLSQHIIISINYRKYIVPSLSYLFQLITEYLSGHACALCAHLPSHPRTHSLSVAFRTIAARVGGGRAQKGASLGLVGGVGGFLLMSGWSFVTDTDKLAFHCKGLCTRTVVVHVCTFLILNRLVSCCAPCTCWFLCVCVCVGLHLSPFVQAFIRWTMMPNFTNYVLQGGSEKGWPLKKNIH